MIVACRGCRRGVSTDAAVCPHCGTRDPYHGWAPPIPSAAPPPEPEPAPRRRRPARSFARRGGFPVVPVLAAALVLGLALVAYNARSRDPGPSVSGDGYPVGQAPRREPENPVADRLRRLEGRYLTGVGKVIDEGRLKRDNPAVEMHLLHEMANCPLLVTAEKYYLPLYVTVKNGRFTGDTDGKVYDTHRLCDRCVK